MSEQPTLDLIAHFGRRLHMACYAGNLNPAQWAALRFAARAKGRGATPSAFARAQATTRSTASQTLRSLQLKGLIRLVPSLHDGRVKQLELTERGADLLARDPLAPVGAALALAEDQTRAAFADLAARCLAAMRV